MSNRGTVPGELSPKEAKEFHVAVLQQLPDISPDRARYFIRHKKELGDRLKQVLEPVAQQSAANILAEWTKFYGKHFPTLDLDISHVRIPDDLSGEFARVLIVAEGLTPEKAYAVCAAKFPCWKYGIDLDRDVTQNERDPNRDGSYAIRVRDRVEADEELENRSAASIREEGLATETCLERLIHELKYWDETGKHLDVQNWTLCSGSLHSDGGVPRAGWFGGRLGVFWFGPQHANGVVRAREVVSS